MYPTAIVSLPLASFCLFYAWQTIWISYKGRKNRQDWLAFRKEVASKIEIS
jgi:hypothetical protein